MPLNDESAVDAAQRWKVRGDPEFAVKAEDPLNSAPRGGIDEPHW